LQHTYQHRRKPPAGSGELGGVDLARIGAERRVKLDAITDQLRRRHWPGGEMP
jgi:hypothetical protein